MQTLKKSTLLAKVHNNCVATRKLHSTTKPVKLYNCAKNPTIEQLLKEIDSLHPKWAETTALIDRKSLIELFQIKLSFTSNAIRGNSITLEDVISMNQTGVTNGHQIKHVEEIMHHNRAVKFMYDKVQGYQITPEIIQAIHSFLVPRSEQITYPTLGGKYRIVEKKKAIATASGSLVVEFENPMNIKKDVEELSQWLIQNERSIHPLYLSTIAHYNLMRIHPFDGGNGRLARLVANAILLDNRYCPLIIEPEQRNEYYNALFNAGEGNIAPLTELLASCMIATQKYFTSISFTGVTVICGNYIRGTLNIITTTFITKMICDCGEAPNSTVEQFEIVIIGAGPHALALTARLLQPDSTDSYTDHEHNLDRWWKSRHPNIDWEKREFGNVTKFGEDSKSIMKIAVIDPSGTWMSNWQNNFNALEIKYLRSTMINHMDPFDPEALRSHTAKYAVSSQMNPEVLHTPQLFQEISHMSSSKREKKLGKGCCKHSCMFSASNRSRFDRPSSKAFQSFYQQMISSLHLEDRVNKDKVTRIVPETNSDTMAKSFLIELESGNVVRTRKVVVAVGQNHLVYPPWVSNIPKNFPGNRLRHALEPIKIEPSEIKDQTIIIIGGGLTSAHLAIAAIRKGSSRVILVSRKKLQVKLFDVDLPWVSKYRKAQFAEFWKLDFEERYDEIQNVRRGGSITPEVMQEVRNMQQQGRIEIVEEVEVESAAWIGNEWRIQLDNHKDYIGNYLWLATGSKNDITKEPLFADLLDKFPIPVVHGFPIVDNDLRWKKGVECYIMGGYAALQLGPDAFNLAAAKSGSERITDGMFRFQSEDTAGSYCSNCDDRTLNSPGFEDSNPYEYLCN